MSKLHIAEGFSLPLEAVTEKVAFLGRTGTGKTYAAMKLAEEMLAAGAQVIALDAVGKWYGLRVAGSGPGFPIPVFGGLNGDLPLESTGGKLIADILTDRGISAVLDVSQFTHGEQTRFAADFATQFFQRKKSSPSAVHVFLEECQEFVPQNAMPGEQVMLSAFERLWKLGRNFGIGGSLISQRPQEINKKALNQTGTLFVFGMTGPQERKAIEQWVSAQGINEDIGDILPTLRQGEPHVWSPTFLGISRTVRVGEKRTADVSSTPKVGGRAKEKPLTPIDAAELKARMAETVERAKADDPKELRKRIADLERQLKGRPAATVEVEKVVEVPVLKNGQLDRTEKIAGRLEQFGEKLRDEGQRYLSEAAELRRLIAPAAGPRVIPKQAQIIPSGGQNITKPPRIITEKPVLNTERTVFNTERAILNTKSPVSSSDHDSLSGPEQRILDALAWLESIGVAEPEQPAAAFLAGYTTGGGAWNNPKGRLRTRGLIAYLPGGRMALTDDGRRLANAPAAPLTSAEMHARVMDRLPGPERKILAVLLEVYPDDIGKDELATRSGYSEGGGAFNNPVGRLRTLGLATYPAKGRVRAADLLFV